MSDDNGEKSALPAEEIDKEGDLGGDDCRRDGDMGDSDGDMLDGRDGDMGSEDGDMGGRDGDIGSEDGDMGGRDGDLLDGSEDGDTGSSEVFDVRVNNGTDCDTDIGELMFGEELCDL